MLKPNKETREGERQPQVGSKSKTFGKHRRMCVFCIKFTSVKNGTKESKGFREGKRAHPQN